MSFIDLETGIRLHYRDTGSGKPILFVPGLAATLDSWNYQVAALHDRFRCLSVDLRGHGDSDKPCSEYSFDEICTDLQAMIKLLDLQDLTLVCWSAGAGVGLNYVTGFNNDCRVSSLVMVGPATPRFLCTQTEPFGTDPETALATLEAMRVALPEVLTAFAEANFHRSDMKATANWFLSLWLKTPVHVACQFFKSLMYEDLRDRLHKVKLPTLICHGRHDQVCDPRWSEYMATRIEDSSLVWFENSGHALMVEEPDKLSYELATFLEK